MRGAVPPLPQYVFMAWCLVQHRDFTFVWFRNNDGVNNIENNNGDDNSNK
jgi:hypothetical protein